MGKSFKENISILFFHKAFFHKAVLPRPYLSGHLRDALLEISLRPCLCFESDGARGLFDYDQSTTKSGRPQTLLRLVRLRSRAQHSPSAQFGFGLCRSFLLKIFTTTRHPQERSDARIHTFYKITPYQPDRLGWREP